MNGIRIKEFQGVIPLWGLLERLFTMQKTSTITNDNTKSDQDKNQNNNQNNNQNDKQNKSQENSFHRSVEAIALMNVLRTPVAKSRGWIRYVLNLRALDECMQIMLSNTRLMTLFYSPDAILSHPDNVIVLMAVVRTLKILPFEFTVEDPTLNSLPTWAAAMVTTGGKSPLPAPVYVDFPIVTGRAAQLVTKAPQKSNKGYLSSFMSTLERGLTGVFESVDISNTNKSDERTVRTGSISTGTGGNNRVNYLIPLFGTSLGDLILDDRRCGVCHIDPLLGIPSMVICMISFLTLNVSTEGLFRTRITMENYEILKYSLEHERGIPKTETVQENVQMVHVVAFTLLQWLAELPEPLLGLTHFYAIEACQEMEDDNPRVRNLSLLILETSWFNQPLLSKLFSLLSLCLDENNKSNGLNIVHLSVLFTPFLYRKKSYLHFSGRDNLRPWGSFYSSLNFDLGSFERDDEARVCLSASAIGE